MRARTNIRPRREANAWLRHVGNRGISILGVGLIGAVYAATTHGAVLRAGDNVAEILDLQITQLDPVGTFLRAAPVDDPVNSPLIVDLGALGFGDGDLISLQTSGTWRAGDPSAFDEINQRTAAVFSSNNVLLGQGDLNRIPGALRDPTDGTRDNVSEPNFNGLPSDIAEDFRAIDAIARTPTEATPPKTPGFSSLETPVLKEI